MCEQSGLQAGDEVRFTVLEKHLEMRVTRGNRSTFAAETSGDSLTQGGSLLTATASAMEDKLHLQQVNHFLCMDFQTFMTA